MNNNYMIYPLKKMKITCRYDEYSHKEHNVGRMKDAAIGYFTNERMPHTVGESKKLTLKEMSVR